MIVIDELCILQCSAGKVDLRYLLASNGTDPVLHFEYYLINLHWRMSEISELHAKRILFTLRFSLVCASNDKH